MKIINKMVSGVCIGVLALNLTGCAPQIGGSDYSLAGAGEINTVNRGVITSVRVVNINAIEANQAGKGTAVGAIGGGLLGSLVGGGHMRLVTGLGGAAVGAIAGTAIERGLTNQQGFEYTVRMDDGSTKAIVQGAEPALGVGQRVRLISSAKSRAHIVADH